MTIIITLSFAGNETGPFDLYSDATGFAIPFAQNVSKAALLAGYQVEAPDGTTVVRLDNLNSLCGSTDIYSCATPNCDFTGSIICDVTTTTTTSSSSTTTTSTTYFPNPFDIPCLWSTNGGNSGLVAVYDFDTNTSTDVLVPNDFTTTIGINRPICATEDKLWLSDGLNYNDAPSGDNNSLFDYSLIREYDISTTSGVTLTYVREIRVDVGRALGNSEGAIKTISVVVTPPVIIPIDPSYPPIPEYWPTSDFPYLLVGAQSPTKAEVAGWDISTTGDIRLGKQDINDWIPFLSFNQIQATNGIAATSLDLTGMFITTDNNVFIASRFNEPGSQGYNQLQEFNGLPPFNRDTTAGWPFGGGGSWTTINQEIGLLPIINLQDQGVPEFTTSWNDIKAMPSWGVDGLLQVLQPETNEVYTISQTPDYEATVTITITDDNVWLSSATGCANVGLLNPDDITGCTPTALPILVESNGASYIGPITFTYFGMSVVASSDVIGGLLAIPSSYPFTTECGIGISAYTQVMYGNTGGASLENPAFSYTLEFPVPVNNIPLRTGVLDVGDDFRFTTNAASTTITMVAGCEATVQNGNDLITDTTAGGGSGSAEVVVTGSEDFTILTFVGTNRGNGGPWSLGCTVPPLNCNRIFSEPNQGRDCTLGVCAPQNNWPSSGPEYKKFYSHNVVTGVIEEITFPAASAFTTPNSGVSENYLINQLLLTNAEDFTTNLRFARYSYDESLTGVPQNLDWDGIVYEIDKNDLPNVLGNFIFGLSTINDNVIVLNYQRFSSAGGGHVVFEAQFVQGSTTLAVTEKFIIPDPFNGGSEHVVTLKEDGVTPNKYIALRSNEPVIISQFDYATGNLEGDVQLSALGNPENYRTSGDMCVIGNFLYISIKDLPNNNTDLWKVDLNTAEWSIVSSDESYNGGSSGSKPNCRISNGFTSFDPSSTTTTTTTTVVPGVNTIWTWFEAETPV